MKDNFNNVETGRISGSDVATSNTPKPGKGLRGFALLTPERRREIASKGGKQAHLLGKAHEFTPEEASAAGRLRHRGRQSYRPNRD